MPSCERYREFILDCLDDEIDVLEKKELEAHLKTCKQCSLYARQCKNLRSLLHHLPKVQAGNEFSIVLRQRIRRELVKKRRYGPLAGIFPIRWVPALGIATIVLVAGVWLITLSVRTGRTGTETVQPADAGTVVPREENINYVIDEVPLLEPGGSLSELENSGEIDSMLAERRAALRNMVNQVSF